MDYTFLGFLAACMLVGCHGNCVEDRKADLKVCLDGLTADLSSKKPSDPIDFLCAAVQKEKLNCIIKHFAECPEFEAEAFIDDLEHDAINFHAKDLFYIKSADEFCKCIPTLVCFENIEVMLLFKTVDRPTWPKVAEPQYICGNGRRDIDCVQNALPTCTRYLQYKHNKSMEGLEDDYFSVGNLSYVGVYAENHCKTWPQDDKTHNCTEKRSTWNAVNVCYNDAVLFKDKSDRMCGMRKCVERAMSTCPRKDMEYFIDSVNVFAPYKIMTTPCQLSSASVTMATLATFLISLCLTLIV